MKLLGLSKLPPDASRSDHLSLIRQHRSVRKERAKSSSPMTLKRGGSASRLGSYRSVPTSADGGGGGVTPTPHYADEETGRGSDWEDDEEDGMMPHQHHHHPNSEWLDMRESSLKLTPTDLDERFLQMITDLMNQFPEPPNSDPITDLSSPATAAFGRRGIHMSKSGSHRRAAGGSGDVVLTKQNPMYLHQQQMAAESKRGRGVREMESPMRIRYHKVEDQFSL